MTVEEGQIRKWKNTYNTRERFFIIMEIKAHDKYLNGYATIRGLRYGNINYYNLDTVINFSSLVEELE
jgi:hypothetical protein